MNSEVDCGSRFRKVLVYWEDQKLEVEVQNHQPGQRSCGHILNSEKPKKWFCICACIYMYISYVYIYTYMYRDKYMCVYICNFFESSVLVKNDRPWRFTSKSIVGGFFNLGVSFNTELLHEDFQGAFCVFFSFSYSFTHTYHPSSFLHFQRNEEEIKWESNCVQEKCSTSRFGCFVLFLISFLPIVCFSVISKDTDRYVGRWDSTENDKQKGGGLCTVVLHLT